MENKTGIPRAGIPVVFLGNLLYLFGTWIGFFEVTRSTLIAETRNNRQFVPLNLKFVLVCKFALVRAVYVYSGNVQ